uniref:FerredoxinNADP reductase leaf isozymeic n=1 Tax=Rhizophora mucronata TaxID=61149 RepID=A0A2P2MHM8_RHIMU
MPNMLSSGETSIETLIKHYYLFKCDSFWGDDGSSRGKRSGLGGGKGDCSCYCRGHGCECCCTEQARERKREE